MVFCGRPSNGCANCRRKRKKCDGAVPACSRCLRNGQTCHGYRDESIIRFRDESAHVSRKARAAQNNKKRDSETLEKRQIRRHANCQRLSSAAKEKSNPQQGNDVVSVGQARPSDINDVSQFRNTPSQEAAASLLLRHRNSYTINKTGYHPAIEQEAISFVAHHYDILELAKSDTGFCLAFDEGSHDLMPKTLRDVIVAIGTAGISHVRGDSYLMLKAQNKHSIVLRHTQTLLAGNDGILDYQIILLVLFLALYENTTCNTPQSLRSWSHHIRGATALLSLQRLDTVNTRHLCAIMLYLRKQAITDCLQRRVPVPPTIIQWSSRVKCIMSEQQIWENSLDEIAIILCKVRTFAGQFGTLDDSVLCDAVTINASLDRWLSNVPAWLSYSTEYNFSNPEEVFFGCYHIYSEPRAALIWNFYRTIRLLTNEVILDTLATLGFPTRLQVHQEASQRWIDQMTAAVCGSVPMLLGYGKNGVDTTVKIYSEILWPLYVCAAHNYALPETRDWVVRQFHRIGRLTGSCLATSLGHVLGSGSEVTVWEALPGSDAVLSTPNAQSDNDRW